MRLMIVSWLSRGLPRQFMVIWANRRCSIWGEIPTLAGGFGRAGLGTDPRAAWVGVPSGSAARVLGGGRGLDVYGVAELLELVEEPPGFALGVAAALEVVGAEVVEDLAGAHDVPDDVEEAVGNRDHRLVRASPACDPTVLGAEVAALGAGGGVGGSRPGDVCLRTRGSPDIVLPMRPGGQHWGNGSCRRPSRR